MTFLLRISRVWLFLILYGIPVLGVIIIPPEIMNSKDVVGVVVPSIGFSYTAGIYLIWMWTVGSQLFRSTVSTMRSSHDFIFFILAISIILIESMLANIIVIIGWFKVEWAWIGYPLIVFTLGSMGSLLYVSAFNAKYLNRKEKCRQVKMAEYAGDAFLFLFYPIGLWFIQPRIRKVFGYDK